MAFIPLRTTKKRFRSEINAIFFRYFQKLVVYLQRINLGMIMCEIIGRKKEIAELKRYYESGRAEFRAYRFESEW